jgi:hypothetical protein
MMNFKVTLRSTIIFVVGLIAAGLLGALLDNEYIGLGVLLAVVAYLATEDKKSS